MTTQAKRIENRIKKLVKQNMTVDNIVTTLAIETGNSDRVAIRDYVTQFLEKMAQEAGFSGPLRELSDDTLIYQLKMRDKGQQEMIPGLAKDCVPDFKEALLRARGILK